MHTGLFRLLTSIMLCLLLTSPARADPTLSEIRQILWQKPDAERAPKALATLRAMANAGKAEAQATLGQMLMIGDYVRPDAAAARILLEKAAQAGRAEASLALGQGIWAELFEDPSLIEAVAHFRRAAEGGNAWAQYILGRLLVADEAAMPLLKPTVEIAFSDTEATHWLTRAAAAGIKPAARQLGWHYLYGTGVEKDEAVGWKWIEAGLRSETPPDALKLWRKGHLLRFEAAEAMIHKQPDLQKERLLQAMSFLRKAAEKEFPRAMMDFEWLASNDHLFKDDQLQAEGKYWLKAAAQAGDAEAMGKYGFLLIFEDQFVEGWGWMLAAAKGGVTRSIREIAALAVPHVDDAGVIAAGVLGARLAHRLPPRGENAECRWVPALDYQPCQRLEPRFNWEGARRF